MSDEESHLTANGTTRTLQSGSDEIESNHEVSDLEITVYARGAEENIWANLGRKVAASTTKNTS